MGNGNGELRAGKDRRLSPDAKTDRTRFTRMCIGEAVIDLLRMEELSRIKVSEVARRAGVSRMTFYHHYASVSEVLQDYMNEMIREYRRACEEHAQQEELGEYRHVLYALEFFDRYRAFFEGMAGSGQYAMLIEGVNGFMEEYFSESFSGSAYERYFYAGGLLNTFMQWQMRGRKESPQEIARVICGRVRSV